MARIPIPVSILNERRDMAASLKAAGLSMKTILQEINKLSPSKKWGAITIRTLERDISLYYTSNSVITDDERTHILGLKKAHFAQMENIIEEVAMMILKNKTWEPAEKITALEKQFKMLASIADLQGWNSSKIRESSRENLTDNKAVALNTYNHGFYGPRTDEILIDDLIAAIPEGESKSFGEYMQKVMAECREGIDENSTSEEIQNRRKQVFDKYKALENKKYPISEEEYEESLIEGEYLKIDDIKKEP